MRRMLVPALALLFATLSGLAYAQEWAGPYVGANVGGGIGNGRWTYLPPPGGIPNPRNDGVIGGGTLGYNFQFQRVVLGLELDADAAACRATPTAPTRLFCASKASTRWDRREVVSAGLSAVL